MTTALPRLGLGLLALGGYGVQDVLSQKQAEGLILSAAAKGITHFDTAPLYGWGQAEYVQGRVLCEHRARLGAIEIFTKVGRSVVPNPLRAESTQPDVWNLPPAPLPYRTFISSWDWSYQATQTSIANSLIRLQVDALEGVSLHDPKDACVEIGMPLGALGGTIGALREYKHHGIIKKIGVGSKDIGVLVDLVRLFPGVWDYFMMTCYNLMIYEEATRDLFPLCKEHGIEIYSAGPYAGGILAQDPRKEKESVAICNYQPADDKERQRAAQLWESANKFGFESPRHAAIQFVLAHQGIDKLIIGARSEAELSENVRYAAERLPSPFWHELIDQGLVAAKTVERLL